MPLQQLYDLGSGQEGYLSELLDYILYSTPIQQYPVDFSYYSESGEFERRKSTSPKSLENYVAGLRGSGSDMSDEYVTNFIVIKNSGGWAPKKKPTVHSISGQGNDMENCEVIDNDLIYCPPSGKCLLMCIYKAFPEIYTKYFQTLFLTIIPQKAYGRPLHFNKNTFNKDCKKHEKIIKSDRYIQAEKTYKSVK